MARLSIGEFTQCFDSAYIIRMLSNTVCRDGNLLLNIGPDAEGCILEEAKKVLCDCGKWLEENGEAVFGTGGGPLQPLDHVYGCTCKENTVYIHILDTEFFPALRFLIVEEKFAAHSS